MNARTNGDEQRACIKNNLDFPRDRPSQKIDGALHTFGLYVFEHAHPPPEAMLNTATRRAVGALSFLQTHRNAHAAADAQGGERLARIAPLHFMQKRHQHTRT